MPASKRGACLFPEGAAILWMSEEIPVRVASAGIFCAPVWRSAAPKNPSVLARALRGFAELSGALWVDPGDSVDDLPSPVSRGDLSDPPKSNRVWDIHCLLVR
jgi:hypothetical protein